jgi:hypothetical protein
MAIWADAVDQAGRFHAARSINVRRVNAGFGQIGDEDVSGGIVSCLSGEQGPPPEVGEYRRDVRGGTPGTAGEEAVVGGDYVEGHVARADDAWRAAHR